MFLLIAHSPEADPPKANSASAVAVTCGVADLAPPVKITRCGLVVPLARSAIYKYTPLRGQLAILSDCAANHKTNFPEFS